MKKANVNAETAQSMNESTKVKGFKPSNSVTTQTVAPTRKETELDFISFIQSEEQISVSKFFKLFESFKVKYPQRYSNYCSAHGLNLNETYDYSWFEANCPRNENSLFSKWVKVSEKVSANKKAEFNRTTEKGVTYTLVPFDTSKASYEQFLPIFLSVVSNMKRIEREKVKAEREAEKAKAKKEAEKKQHEKNLKLIDSLFAEITALSKDFGLPFETAISVYERTKGANYSKELRSMLVAKANEQK